MIFKYLWDRLHGPFIKLVGFIFSVLFMVWLVDENVWVAMGVIVTIGIIFAVSTFWPEISEDYKKYSEARDAPP